MRSNQAIGTQFFHSDFARSFNNRYVRSDSGQKRCEHFLIWVSAGKSEVYPSDCDSDLCSYLDEVKPDGLDRPCSDFWVFCSLWQLFADRPQQFIGQAGKDKSEVVG